MMQPRQPNIFDWAGNVMGKASVAVLATAAAAMVGTQQILTDSLGPEDAMLAVPVTAVWVANSRLRAKRDGADDLGDL